MEGIKVKLEQIDQLRERANVTYEEAKEALEKCNEDMVEALIYLEKKQKVKTEPVKNTNCGVGIGRAVKNLIHKGNTTKLIISKGENEVLKTPVTIAVVATVIAPYLTLGGTVIALCAGYKVKFLGRDGSNMEVNKVIDKVSDAVDAAKSKLTEKNTTNA